MKTLSATAVTLAALVLAGPAQAGSITYTGSFDVEFASGSPITNFSGGFSFQFDESVVLGVGNETFFRTLDSLTLNPASIGSTTFTTANVQVVVLYLNGVLTFANLYATVGGSGVSVASNDFYVSFSGPDLGSAPLYSALYATEAGTGFFSSTSGTGSITGTAVPEPSSLAMVGIAGAILTAAARRRRAG